MALEVGMRGGTDMKIFYKGAKTYFSGNKGKVFQVSAVNDYTGSIINQFQLNQAGLRTFTVKSTELHLNYSEVA